ncbi:MAG: metallophosphoesterase, partial [Clostridia bacterium]|nr:metallophosphoesterase [Clostridia bacterium]
PFKNVKEYDKFTIKQWNKAAKQGDTVYVVGDLLDCDGPKSTEWAKGLKLIKKIKADIVLVIGNNEQRIIKMFFNNNYDDFVRVCKEHGIKEVYKNLDLEFANHKFHLTHQIKDGKKNKINLFGHTHLCSGVYHPYGLCVSCNLNHFRLFTEEIILGYLKRKTNYWEADENCNYINPFLKVIDGKVINIKQNNNKFYQNYLKSNDFK